MRATLITALLSAAAAMTAAAAPPIHVMLLDGEQAGAYHAWQETTPYLRRMLEDAGIFQVVGHDLAALKCVGFMTTYQRGTEWAATGKVTQKVPADFPTTEKTSTRKQYDPPAGWVSPGGRPQPK